MKRVLLSWQDSFIISGYAECGAWTAKERTAMSAAALLDKEQQLEANTVPRTWILRQCSKLFQ